MIRCRDIERLSSAYIDGELDHERGRAYREHMGQCASCRQSVHELVTILDVASSLAPIDPPDRLWYTVRRDVAEASVVSVGPSWVRRLWSSSRFGVVGLVGGAAVVAVAVVVVVHFWSAGTPPHDGASTVGEAHGLSTTQASDNRRAPGGVSAFVARVPSLHALATFSGTRTRDVLDTDRMYLTTIGELRQILDEDREAWPPAVNVVVDTRLHLFEKAAHRHQQLLAMATTTEGRQDGRNSLNVEERDALYDVYRAEIAFLQQAVIDGPPALSDNLQWAESPEKGRHE